MTRYNNPWIIYPIATLAAIWTFAMLMDMGYLIQEREQFGMRLCSYLTATGVDTRVMLDVRPCNRLWGI
jgi:hypothetical protein